MDLVRIDLHAGWEFAFAAHGAVNAPGDCGDLTFRPARVPGTNLTDLQAAGLVEPGTSASYEDSFTPYAGLDFIYRTQFEGGEAAGRRNVRLCFDGLDTVCEVWLNGERIASVDNCYLGYELDVAGKLSQGANSLWLLFRSPVLEAERRRERYDRILPGSLGGDFMFLRKPAYSFYWDWGPRMPVSGIWRPVYLKAFDRAEIADFHVRYRLDGRDVAGTVEVTAPGGDGATARLSIAGQEFSAPVEGGSALVPFELQQVSLWYPNGEGEPTLYDLQVTLDDGRVLDTKQRRLGFRTIELLRDERSDGRGSRFRFRVNGRDIWARGYNWIPVDSSLPRGLGPRQGAGQGGSRAGNEGGSRTAPTDLYRGNLDLARAGNANMLRIWGGGYYEDDEFYRLCDERGLLVWQDGMFCCAMYPDTDPEFMDSVRQELVYNIRRLRNYTSLALWCGENENHWGFEEWWPDRTLFPDFLGGHIYDELFPALLQELDPDRPYWNGSPYSEEPGVAANDPFHGDTHLWDLHSDLRDLAHYRRTAPSFVSETGIQSLPDLRTALTIGQPEDRHVQSFLFDSRNHFSDPAKNERLLKFTGALLRVSGQFQEAVVRSNLAHGEYLKYAVEHWRSQACDCAGVLIWQLNDCWPAVSWAAVDYNLAPKACWYYLRRAYAPDLVGFLQRHSPDYDPEVDAWGELFVASERDGDKTGLVELRALSTTGEEIEARTVPVLLKGRGAASLGHVRLPGYQAHRFDGLLQLTLRWEGEPVATNLYTYSRPKHMRLPRPQVQIHQEGPDTFRVRTDLFAKGVYLLHPDVGVVFDDNYFDLLPGEVRLVRSSKPVDPREIKAVPYYHNL